MSDQSVSDEQPLAAPPGVRWRRIKPWIASGLIVIALGNTVRVPYLSVGPGPATNILESIEVVGSQTHPAAGQLLLTTATLSGRSLSVFEYLWANVDPRIHTVPAERFRRPGVSDEEQSAHQRYEMENSKLNAELAAFEALGLDVPIVPGARVLSLLANAPADGVLLPGDRIFRVDDTRIDSHEDLFEVLRARSIGDEVDVTVLRKGTRRTERLTLAGSPREPDVPHLGIYVAPAYRFPARIEIDTHEVGGPSGGLVFALALIDLFTPEDLTRGRTIAVTGVIEWVDGVAVVGGVGGLPEKVRGSRELGVQMWIVPEVNAHEVREAAPAGIEVWGVSTLAEAIDALRSP